MSDEVSARRLIEQDLQEKGYLRHSYFNSYDYFLDRNKEYSVRISSKEENHLRVCWGYNVFFPKKDHEKIKSDIISIISNEGFNYLIPLFNGISFSVGFSMEYSDVDDLEEKVSGIDKKIRKRLEKSGMPTGRIGKADPKVALDMQIREYFSR